MYTNIMDILKEITLSYFSKDNDFDQNGVKTTLYQWLPFGTRYEIGFYENKIEYHLYEAIQCNIITVYKNGDVHSKIQIVYGSFSF